MAQRLRALVVLPEDPGAISSTHVAPHSSREDDTPSHTHTSLKKELLKQQ